MREIKSRKNKPKPHSNQCVSYFSLAVVKCHEKKKKELKEEFIWPYRSRGLKSTSQSRKLAGYLPSADRKQKE